MPDLRLGGLVDPAAHQRTGTDAVLRSADLTTHGVIVGMTGSGKTGLGVVLVEECLAAGVPAIVVDPKGDLTNLCLLFPELSAAQFRPWVDEGAAVATGMTPDAYAEDQATRWREGLAGWDLGRADVARLSETVPRTVYTPGSTAGVPLNVVGSLVAPADRSDEEAVQDEIAAYVSSLLGLLGVDADPLTSREHVLLANLVWHAWSGGQDLDLPTLVAWVAQPPIRKVGVLELDQFFPPADRQAFVLRLNNLLASPGFAAWLQGPPIDVDALVRGADGGPRCAIVTTSHLDDSERQAVTALVLAEVVAWMRRQPGTADLRLLLYLDEVAGLVPPTANPPTKPPLLTLMKQARAYGVGVVLATQNPVDVDYKALSNAGTWLIGRLQTERDKARLLDGLTSAAGTVDVAALGDTVSGLAKREFVLRRAGSDRPETMTTRWAMSYLRGPLTREQIARLAADQPAAAAPPAELAPPSMPAAPDGAPVPMPPPSGDPGPAAAGAPVSSTADVTPVMPAVAAGIPVSYLDPAAAWAGVVGAVPGTRLRAAAVARVRLRYDETRADLVHDEEYEAVLCPLPDVPDAVGFVAVDYDDRDLLPQPVGAVTYEFVAAAVSSKTWWSGLRAALTDHLVRSRVLEVPVNRELKLYGRVGETAEQFAGRCAAEADSRADAATAALRTKYEAKVRALQDRIDTAVAAVQRQEASQQAAYADAATSVASSVLGGLFGGRRSRASVSAQARRISGAAARVDQARAKVDSLAAGLAQLDAELADEVAGIDREWTERAAAVSTVAVPLERTDVRVADLRLVWVPVG
ncbi:MAG: helicase HerA-like domain-containing protein [Candidatus Nanopelagicales bacterium]